MTALDGFNRIARVYDPLKRLVFGKTLLKSQLHFLSAVPRGATVLILGGGTGEILLPLVEEDADRRIVYVEASSEMLSRARERVQDRQTGIDFIHGTHESLPPGLMLDVIITNFFLDLFPDQVAATICRQLQTALRDDGVWLVSDFVNAGRWWQRPLLHTMYIFFNLMARVEAKSLPAWEKHLRQAGLVETVSASYCRGFVRTSVYKKSGPMI